MTVVHQDISAELAALRAENAQLKAKAARQAQARLSCKVSEKGAVSVYGMGRFPLTLYKGQWEKLIAYVPTIQEFILDNSAALTTKD